MKHTVGKDTSFLKCSRIWTRLPAALLCLALLSACAGNPGGPGQTEAPTPVLPTLSEDLGGETLPSGAAEPTAAGTSGEGEDVSSLLTSNTIYYREYYPLTIAPDLYHASNSADDVISALIDDYDVMSTDQQGRYVVNSSVCEAMEDIENDDGSHTVTVTLRKGLRYNNGEPITAVDYLVSALIDFSPVSGNSTARLLEAKRIVGAEAYLARESDTISGLKLLDDYRYSVTIPAEAVELYYNCANVSLRPLNAALYGASAVVEGETVRLTGLTAAGVSKGSTVYVDRVCAGPYQIESVDMVGHLDPYDVDSHYRFVLRVNEHYAGNFEGQKPRVERIVIAPYSFEEGYERLPRDEASYFSKGLDGYVVQSYQRFVDAGRLTAAAYPRSGFGKLLFQCDMGPTQFQAVRQAVACLIDREGYAEEFCQGYGSVVNGPYDPSRWEYRENAAELEEKLELYVYDQARAVKLLEEDGWVLGEDGSPYVSGLRYKQVTPEEAGDFVYNITLPDGRILMPLKLDLADTNPNPNLVMEKYLCENQAMVDAGIQINQVVMSFDDLLNYLYRDEEALAYYHCGPNTYCLCTLAENLKPKYDFSAHFTGEDNVSHMDSDGRLARLSRQMLQAPDDAAFAALWKDFVLEWNVELPGLPLYQNIYYDFMDSRIHGLTPNAYWPFERAVLYATVDFSDSEP